MTDYTTHFSQTASAEEIYCLPETLRAENACQKANDSVVLLLMSETSREVSVVEGQPSSQKGPEQVSTDLKHLSSVADEYDKTTPPSGQNLHALFHPTMKTYLQKDGLGFPTVFSRSVPTAGGV